jgi:hypothetical protein
MVPMSIYSIFPTYCGVYNDFMIERYKEKQGGRGWKKENLKQNNKILKQYRKI